MTEDAAMGAQNPQPAWLALLQKPYEGLLGSKTTWDLRMPDGTAVRIERGSQGLNNALYRVRIGTDVYACKLSVVDERQRSLREWTALVALHAAGLKVAPEPIAYAPNGPLPQPIVAFRWSNGVPLSGQALDDESLALLVEELNEIHRTPPAGVEPLTAWQQPASYGAYLTEIQQALDRVRRWAAECGSDLDRLPAWVVDLPGLLPVFEQVAAGAQAAVAEAETDGSCPIRALVRVDGNPDNIMREPEGRLVFVDWEYSGWGDPAYDLADLRWHPRNLPVDQGRWETALARYVPLPQDHDFHARLATYSRLLPAHWVGRSALHLLQGAGQAGGRQRLARVPARLYRSVRKQLDNYLAALGLIEPPEASESEDE